MDNLWHEEDIDVALKVTNDIHFFEDFPKYIQ